MSTAFGKAVKTKLIEINQNQNWLIEQVKEKSGLFCDSSVMSRLLNGSYSSSPMRKIICEILGIKEVE